MYRTIVVPVDCADERTPAVAHGQAVARDAGATLELLTVRPSYMTEAETSRHLAEVADRHGVEAKLTVEEPSEVVDFLVDTASDPGVLLCLQTHARRPLTELVLGSISEEVVRRCRRPVLLIGPRCAPPPDRYRSMVVALDGSTFAEQILPVVVDWSRQLGVIPWLLEVLPANVPLETGSNDVFETVYLHRVADRLAVQGVRAEWDTLHHRNPASAITEYVDGYEHSLVALTTHGHSGLGRVAMGGVALKVAHRATVPVLVLGPDEASPPGAD
jgi:nucleotide-binding universal stress UspA family protein